jgi:hypothetical protein
MAQNVVSSRLKSHDYIAYIAYITTKPVGLLALSFRLPTLPTIYIYILNVCEYWHATIVGSRHSPHPKGEK